MTRHLDIARIAPTPRRAAGTPAVAAIALAAAFVLAACGPDDPTAAIASAPLEVTQTTTTVTTTTRPATAATVITAKAAPTQAVPAQIVQVADRQERVAPRGVFGQVSSIEPITQTPKTSGTGAVVGGVLGAVIGNQVGSGNGRAAATVLGGVGGAVVGNKVEKHRSETVTGYRVHVQLDNGSSRSFERTTLGGLDVGDRVRVDGNRLREV